MAKKRETTAQAENLEFELNSSRLLYLLDQFKLSKKDFLEKLNESKKKPILNIEELETILVNKAKIKLSTLKSIDTLFNKGLTWYISARDITERKSSSIFFRKDTFNTELSFESKKLISRYEDLKFEIHTLCKQANFEPTRLLKKYTLTDNAEIVAKEIRTKFDEIQANLLSKKEIKKPKEDREYIETLMRIMEQLNIFIFEFVDRSRRPDKEITFNGFFIAPEMIVIKRQQRYLRREIFTLLHEVGHYLLNIEEIDSNVEINTFEAKVEQWCNSFAHAFLLSGHEAEFNSLSVATSKNNFHQTEIKSIYAKTYLSELALYTKLKINHKISSSDYETIQKDIISQIKKREEIEKNTLKKANELKKLQGKPVFMSGPKEIESNLFREIVKINFFEGNIRESKLRDYLKIKNNQTIDGVVY